MTATFTGSESENWHWDCDSVGRLEKKRAKKNNTKEARKKNRRFHNGCDIHSHSYLCGCIRICLYLYLCGMACKSQDLRLSTMLFIGLSRFVAARSRCFYTWSGFNFQYFCFSGVGAIQTELSCLFRGITQNAEKNLGSDRDARNATQMRCPGMSVVSSSVIYLHRFLVPS